MAWGTGALASVVLVLGVNGTLSSWTSAIINNDDNHTQSVTAVALTESYGTSPVVSCDTGSAAGNTATCSTINKYGGTALDPDEDVNGDLHNTSSTTVTLKNTGSAEGVLKVGAGACSTTASGTTSPTVTPRGCGVVTLAVACVDGQTPPVTTPMFATGTLTAFDAAGSLPASGLTLAAGESVDCTFDVTLPTTALAQYSNKQANQAVTWTLTKS